MTATAAQRTCHARKRARRRGRSCTVSMASAWMQHRSGSPAGARSQAASSLLEVEGQAEVQEPDLESVEDSVVAGPESKQSLVAQYLRQSSASGGALQRALRAERRAGQDFTGGMLATEDEQAAHARAFTRDFSMKLQNDTAESRTGDYRSIVPNSAAFCLPEPQWFAVEVYYKEGTEMELNTARRIGVVAGWVERAMKTLKPVTLPNGKQVPRVIETWIPKKRIPSINSKTGRKGTKTLIWDNAETLLVQTIMDNDLAYYLERQMAATSEALDAKVALTSVRVAKQMDYRGMDSFGGAPTRTMLHRYKFSKRVRLFPKEIIEIPSRFARGEQDELEARLQRRLRAADSHLFPLPCPDSLLTEVKKWLETEEVWDPEKSIRTSKNIALQQLFGVTEERLAQNEEVIQARKAAEQEADLARLTEPQPKPQRRRRRKDDPTPEEEAQALFNPDTPYEPPPTPARQPQAAEPKVAEASPQISDDSAASTPHVLGGPVTGEQPGEVPQPGPGQQQQQQQASGAGLLGDPGSIAKMQPPGSRRGMPPSEQFADEIMASSAASPAGWNIGARPNTEKKARPPTGARRDLSQPAVKVPDEQQEWYTLSRDRRAQMAAHAVDELPKALDHRKAVDAEEPEAAPSSTYEDERAPAALQGPPQPLPKPQSSPYAQPARRQLTKLDRPPDTQRQPFPVRPAQQQQQQQRFGKGSDAQRPQSDREVGTPLAVPEPAAAAAPLRGPPRKVEGLQRNPRGNTPGGAAPASGRQPGRQEVREPRQQARTRQPPQDDGWFSGGDTLDWNGPAPTADMDFPTPETFLHQPARSSRQPSPPARSSQSDLLSSWHGDDGDFDFNQPASRPSQQVDSEVDVFLASISDDAGRLAPQQPSQPGSRPDGKGPYRPASRGQQEHSQREGLHWDRRDQGGPARSDSVQPSTRSWEPDRSQQPSSSAALRGVYGWKGGPPAAPDRDRQQRDSMTHDGGQGRGPQSSRDWEPAGQQPGSEWRDKPQGDGRGRGQQAPQGWDSPDQQHESQSAPRGQQQSLRGQPSGGARGRGQQSRRDWDAAGRSQPAGLSRGEPWQRDWPAEGSDRGRQQRGGMTRGRGRGRGPASPREWDTARGQNSRRGSSRMAEGRGWDDQSDRSTRAGSGWYSPEVPGQPDRLPPALTGGSRKPQDVTATPGWQDRAATAAAADHDVEDVDDGAFSGWYTGEDVS